MNITLSTESRQADRFFVARIDGRETMFVLRADHSVCIARAIQPDYPPRRIEPGATVFGEVYGLAARVNDDFAK